MLGFKINPKLTPLVEKEGEQVGVSEERLDVLDADVIVFATEKPSDDRRPQEGADVRQARRGFGEPLGVHRRDARGGACTSSAR